MKLAWYLYFSWWIFIWFILFKLNFIPYSPYLIYRFILLYIIYKSIEQSLVFIKNDQKIDYSSLKTSYLWIIIAFLLDVLPIFFLKKNITIESIYFTLGLSIIYILMMIYLGIDVIKHYNQIDFIKLSENYTPKQIIKEMLLL